MAAPVDSPEAPGREPIWLNPVGCGVRRLGVLRPPAPAAAPLPDEAPLAMPLYLVCADG